MGMGKVLDVLLMPPGLGGFGIGKGFFEKMEGKGQSDAPKPAPLPQTPSAEASGEKAQETIRRRKATMSQSIYTSPLGISSEAQVARKTLLGQ